MRLYQRGLTVLLGLLLLTGCAGRPTTTPPGGAPPAGISTPGVPSGGAPTGPADGHRPALLETPAKIEGARAEPTGLRVIRFADRQHGWAGGNGLILSTVDGGRSWQRRTVSGEVRALSAPDAQHAWAITTQALLRTADGGSTWDTLNAAAQPLVAIDFTDRANGWAVSSKQELYHTGDGGATWETQGTRAAVQSVCAADRQTAWAASGTAVFQTRDGGRTWAEIWRAAELTGDYWEPHLFCRGPALWVYLYGGSAANQSRYVIYRSGDGGQSWAPELVDRSHVYPELRGLPNVDDKVGAVAAVDGDTAYVAGLCTACYPGTTSLTYREGGQWRHKNLDALRWVADLTFADAQHGWLLAGRQESQILATADGGHTWEVQYPVVGPRPSRAVSMVTATLGYGLGLPADDAAVLQTLDGGVTWRRLAELPHAQPAGPLVFPSLFLSFPDAANGWAVSPGGQLMHTTDGGQNWSRVVSATAWVRSVYFITLQVGCIQTGNPDGYAATRDGGATWLEAASDGGVAACAARAAGYAWATHAPPGPNSGHGSTVLDAHPNRSWAMLEGPGSLEQTTDSGQTWTAYKLPAGVMAQSLSSIDDRQAWLLERDGQLLQTVDGGASWAPPAAAIVTWRTLPAEVQQDLLQRGERSSDGQWLAGKVTPRDGRPQLWLAATDQSWVRLVERDLSGYGAGVWSPRGTFLYWRDRDDSWQEVNPATGQVTPFLPAALQGRRAAVSGFSADGQRVLYTTGICYCNTPSARPLHTYAVNLDGTGLQDVGIDVDAHWDGNRVVAVQVAPSVVRLQRLSMEKTAQGDVWLLPRPATFAVSVRAAVGVELRAFAGDRPTGPPLTALEAREAEPGSWVVEWASPPTQPVHVWLYLAVRPEVPDDPAFHVEGGRRFVIYDAGLVQAP